MNDVPIGILLLAGILVAMLALLAVSLYVMVYGARAKLRRRVAQVAGPASGLARANGSAAQRRKGKSIQGKLKELEATRQNKRGYKLREDLVQAGLALSVRQFVLASIGIALVVAVGSALAGMPIPIVVALTIIAGLGLPKATVKLLIRRRLKSFTTHFADAIDVIVRGVRSGLPVGECFAIIARDSPDPVGSEFRTIVEGQRLGLTLDEALQKAMERVPTAEMRFFGIVLGIQQTTGGNLAETLAKLSEVLRARKRMRDKIRAMSSEATATAGIIGSLPVVVALLLSFIAPSYIALLFTTNVGHLILFVAVCVMCTGIMVMRRMINFDI